MSNSLGRFISDWHKLPTSNIKGAASVGYFAVLGRQVGGASQRNIKVNTNLFSFAGISFDHLRLSRLGVKMGRMLVVFLELGRLVGRVS